MKRDEKLYTRIQSIRHKLASSNNKKKRTLTTSVIPSPRCDPWYDRSAHTSWPIHNQSSEPRRQTDGVKGRERRFLFAFCLSCFSNTTPSSIMFPLWGGRRVMFIKGSEFSKLYLRIKMIENTCGSTSRSPQFLDIFGAVSTRSKTVSSFSQSLPGVWKPFQSEQAINSCFFFVFL